MPFISIIPEITVHFPRFLGNSYLEHPVLNFSEQSSNELFVSVKTTSTNGTVLYSASDRGDFIHLFIEEAVLKYQLSCGRTSVLTIDTQIRVNTDILVNVEIM